MKPYIPGRGDIVWLNFNPQAGHEQMGKRPAMVILPKEYNEKAGLGLFCPITSKINYLALKKGGGGIKPLRYE